jgi:hypothetical protein
MISSTQLELLAVLRELSEISPDVRLGQLMAHIGFLADDQFGRTLWDIDDDELLAVLHHHQRELKSRSGSMAAVPPTSIAAVAEPDSG